jgi:4-alpha-glucanotransferase
MTGNPIPHRQAGVLLHPTSLPGPGDHGDLGADAFRFIDFLAAAGIGVWQVLPLGPTHGDRSPYQCLSVHAGSPALISLQSLVDQGWLPGDAVPVDRDDALHLAHQGFIGHHDPGQHQEYQDFLAEQTDWLDDFALFIALRKAHQNQGWTQWPATLRDRDPAALGQAREELSDTVEQARFEQFLFHRQWHALRNHAAERKVRLFGDLPIFVAHDSADVWSNRGQFLLDEHGEATVVAGVPPDYFSATGQRWGNPLYDWDAMAADGYAWWRTRLRNQMAMFDLVRIDHFRGFEAYWEIPGHAETAIDGHWVPGPGNALFEAIAEDLGLPLPLVAEDLGVITPEVEALRDRWGLPGMKILQFAFDGSPNNPYLPHNHKPLGLVYTGTHDNDTTLGWYNSLDEHTKARVNDYLGRPGEVWPWPLIRSAWASVACLSVVPMQDLLGLGGRHRMNVPGVADGNWTWRFEWDSVTDGLAERIRGMVASYDRLSGGC